MKILALFFLMANIVFFLWEYHSGAFSSDKRIARMPQREFQPIFLAGEVNRELENKAAALAAKKAIPAIPTRMPLLISDLFNQKDNLSYSKGSTPTEVKAKAPASNLLPDGIQASAYPFPIIAGLESDAQIKIGTAMEKPAARTDQQKHRQIEITAPIKSSESTDILPAIDTHEKTAAQSATATLVIGRKSVLRTQTAVIATNTSPSNAAPSHPSEPVEMQQTANDKPPGQHENQQAMCYEAGPFENKAFFNRWRKLTGIDRAFIKPIIRDDQETTGYQVYYPAAATFEQSVANLEMLKQQGINDYWLFRKGKFKGEISLGIFKNENRAEMLKQQLLAKGLNVDIKPRYKIKHRIYAQISQEYEDSLNASLEKWTKQHPGFTVKATGQCEKTTGNP